MAAQIQALETMFPFLQGTRYTPMQFSRGNTIFNEGDECGVVGFIVRGVIKVYKLAESGREIALYRIGKGESCMLSLACALSYSTHRASAIVEEDVEIVVVPVNEFRRLLDNSSEARQFVFSLFSHRLADMLTLVEEVVFHRTDERLAELLLHRARNAVVEATHEELAFELGSAREVVSRLLKEFEKEGSVRLGRGKIVVEDAELLHRKKENKSSFV